MSDAYAIYVPYTKAALQNLEIGLEHGVWGWKDSALKSAASKARVNALVEGDYVWLATGGGNPRVPSGGWAGGGLQRLVVLQVGRALYEESQPRWPDDDYPNRVDLQPVVDLGAVSGEAVGESAMEALRHSAVNKGLPYAVADPWPLLAAQPQALPAEVYGEDDLTLDGPLDVLRVGWSAGNRARSESRSSVTPPEIRCDLCGKTYPARFVRAAHIKRRADCTLDEKRDLHNVMAACVFGCDELFEHGYIGVGSNGHIVGRPNLQGDVSDEVASRTGLQVVGGMPGVSADYYRWHREQHQLPDAL